MRIMVAVLVATLALGANPDTELTAALTDLANVSSIERATTRYLTLYNVPLNRRPAVAASCSLALNLVSRTPNIARPIQVSETLFRIDLNSYGIPTPAWEAMVSAGEPYWHLRTQAIDPTSGKVKTVYTDLGSVELKQAEQLRAATGSGGALVRADWLHAKAITTVDGFYYELSGIAETKDINALYSALGIDFATTDRLQLEAWSALKRSDVTQKPRRVIRRQGAAGGAWKTEDTADEDGDEDPLRDPLGRKHDASEHIVTKLNGLPLFVLANGKGAFVRTVPDNIAKDTTDAHANGGILAPSLSCLGCHRETALQPFQDDFKRLIASRIEAYFGRYEDQVRARAVFERNTQLFLERDRQDFGRAIELASGLDYQNAVRASVETYQRYVGPVGYDEARRELDIHPDVSLMQVFASSQDPYLLDLGKGVAMSRKQWDLSYPVASALAKAWRSK